MAIANVRTVALSGGLKLVFGDFTATAGGGSQTIATACGRVLLVQVNPQVSADPVDVETSLYSVSQSGAIATVTIYGNSAITAGSFCMLVDMGG